MLDGNNENEKNNLKRSVWKLGISTLALCVGCASKGLGWIVGIWLGLQVVGGIDFPFNCNIYGF